jgi:hypothetical protein
MQEKNHLSWRSRADPKPWPAMMCIPGHMKISRFSNQRTILIKGKSSHLDETVTSRRPGAGRIRFIPAYQDVNYLIEGQSSPTSFIIDTTLNIGYANANGSVFLNAIWNYEKVNQGRMASPQALLELQAYSFVPLPKSKNIGKDFKKGI